MANMSYCRFENTSHDLSDCVIALQEEGLDSLSAKEKNKAKYLYELAQEYIDAYEEQVYLPDDNDDEN